MLIHAVHVRDLAKATITIIMKGSGEDMLG